MADSVAEEIRELESLLGSSRDPRGRVFAPLADAYRRLGDHDRALELLAEGVRRDPGFGPGHVVTARVRLDRGEAELAVAAFEAALALDPENAEAIEGLGALRERGRAERPADDGLGRSPAKEVDAPVTRTMADLYARQGLHDRALAVYRKLLDQDPGDPGLLERVAELEAARAEAASAAGGAEVDVETLARDWAEGTGAVGDLDSPFAWASPASSAAPSAQGRGRPARDYFRRLLEWEPGAAPAAEPSAEAAEDTPPGPVAPVVTTAGAATPAGAVDILSPWDFDLPPEPPRSATPAEAVPSEAPVQAPVQEAEPEASGTVEPVLEPVLEAEPEEPVLEGRTEVVAQSDRAAEAIPIEAIAPDAVPIASLAPDAVPIASLAPDVVPVASLAPDAVPIASLAPDPAVGEGAVGEGPSPELGR